MRGIWLLEEAAHFKGTSQTSMISFLRLKKPLAIQQRPEGRKQVSGELQESEQLQN